MRRARFLLLLATACGGEPAREPTAIPVAPAVVETAPPAPPPRVVADAGSTAQPESPHANALLDLAHAPLVLLKSAPAKATAPKPVGTNPAKTRTLRQTDIPLSFKGKDLGVISESGGRLLLSYGGRWLAVVDGKTVEEVVDFDPPDLPLTADDRAFADIEQAVYRDGIVYACRGYNAWLKTRKGIVTAIDAATGDLRWRSDVKVCGGVLTLLDDYVVTGYGAVDTPYAIKLLRAYDGSTAQSITLFGAAIEMYPSGDQVVAITYKDRVTYQLSP